MGHDIEALLQQIHAHYTSRGFSRPVIEELVASVRRSHRNWVLYLPGAVLSCNIARILTRFLPRQDTPANLGELQAASAIFAFSFGYRLKSQQGFVPAARLPGQNNRGLAGIVVDLHTQFPSIPVCAQFVIADSLEDHDPPILVACRTPAEDWGTKAVLDYFLRYLGWHTLNADGSVIVVAHAHHVWWCLMLVEDVGLRGLLPSRSYNEYDEHEQQPRVRNEREFIHSDFVSLVATWCR
jgi:hypothetical protein